MELCCERRLRKEVEFGYGAYSSVLSAQDCVPHKIAAEISVLNSGDRSFVCLVGSNTALDVVLLCILRYNS